MSTKNFPALNFGNGLYDQLFARAHYVGFVLEKLTSPDVQLRWRLSRKLSKEHTQSFTYDSLAEVELKIDHLLRIATERFNQKQMEEMLAERDAIKQAKALMQATRTNQPTPTTGESS